MSRKIAVVTGSRAEYGLLRWVMEGIKINTALKLQVIVTGMHLSPEFGLTYREIEKDGFVIDRKVEMLLSSDTSVGVTKAIGLGIIGFADALNDLQPDLLLVLGDRFEIHAAATAAMIARIPIAHLHGGESSEGAFDEAIRHAITKMSHLHFVAAQAYKNRVIQLGEPPERVFLVGGLGIDSIKKLTLLEKNALEVGLDFKFGQKNLLLTFHPSTLENQSSEQQMTALLEALEAHPDLHLIVTMPNADTDSRVIIKMINEFVSKRSNAKAYTSLGQQRYFSCLQYVDGVIGNSSSGLIEVPSFRKGTINIGDRQRGRLKAPSVIDCEPTVQSIAAAIEILYSSSFQTTLPTVCNPYGEGGASEKIVQVLQSYPLDSILKKSFHDLGCESCVNQEVNVC
jgi:GDP/UDP-N,N'-diacetylbacillosamine 2-epimerase (hydrolysing)